VTTQTVPGSLPNERRYFGVRDRAGWTAGPWDAEPDKIQWDDPATGLPCLIVRNRLGALCGYAGVLPGHPLHGLDEDRCPVACGEQYCDHRPHARLAAHGGINFASACQQGAEESVVCHVPAPGQPADAWWFGFDTAHACDRVPGMSYLAGSISEQTDVYRDLVYVQVQVTALAAQLAAIGAADRCHCTAPAGCTCGASEASEEPGR
jgi:hypothetical protein